MCRRFALFDQPAALCRDFGLEPAAIRPRYNIAPGRAVPVVVQDDGPPHLVSMHWGLDGGTRLFNVRAESIAHRPTLRTAFRTRRCLVPASGYYQWTRRGRSGRAEPYYCTAAKADEPLAFAALWEMRPDSAGPAFAILTTAAADAVQPIHDRMPATIPRIQWRRWLDPNNHDYFSLLTTLLPTMSVGLRSWKVGDHVNDLTRDCKDCVQRVA